MLAEIVLVLANLVYATSYVTTRLTLGHVGPATLAFARLLIATVVLVPLVLLGRGAPPRGSPGRITWPSP